jgi:hypothetical protein
MFILVPSPPEPVICERLGRCVALGRQRSHKHHVGTRTGSRPVLAAILSAIERLAPTSGIGGDEFLGGFVNCCHVQLRAIRPTIPKTLADLGW